MGCGDRKLLLSKYPDALKQLLSRLGQKKKTSFWWVRFLAQGSACNHSAPLVLPPVCKAATVGLFLVLMSEQTAVL